MKEFADAGIHGHVWQRKELESYLLNPKVLSRLASVPETQINSWLDEITSAMESEVFGRLLDERFREEVSGSKHAVSVTTSFKPEFDQRWSDPDYRLEICPPKQIVSKLNAKLQDNGFKAVSLTGLARGHRRSELPKRWLTYYA